MDRLNLRRKKLIKILKTQDGPLSGSFLAKKLNVTRQIIVQDIAILRAENHPITSSNKGYSYNDDTLYERVFAIQHDDSKTKEELYLIIDTGGIVKDVFINHPIYGEIRVDLNLKSRREVDQFLKDIHHEKSEPIKNLTGDKHFHTVVAENEEILDEVESSLMKNGFIVMSS